MLLTSPPIVRSAVLRLSTTAQKQVNAPVAWQRWGLDGTGIGVAVIDSGVTAVGDLYWWIDRKSTRLNSSHGYISYAVFCLKKKKKNKQSNQLLAISTNADSKRRI